MMIRKFFAELIGTMFLVIIGCGTAVALTPLAEKVVLDPEIFTIVPIALAFGLVLVALCYTIGRVSGSHVNPAVSIAMLINGKISAIDCVYYIAAQLIGAVAGAEVLAVIFDSYKSLGTNGYGELSALGTTMNAALIVEIILTFIFVLTVLCVTSRKQEESSNNGIIIGLALFLVHIFGIPFTGTSVNPARSFGPAILCGSELVLEQLWVFIVGPIAGAILAALFFKFVIEEKEAISKKKSSK